MAEPTKPTKDIHWATSGSADKVEPGGAKKDLGWVADEKPPHNFFNWFWNAWYLWIDWFDEKLIKLIGHASNTTLTISSGVIIPTQGNHDVDTEGAGPTDDLDRIDVTNMDSGRLVMINIVNGGRVVVLKHQAGGVGQLWLQSQTDITLTNPRDHKIFHRDGNDWVEILNSKSAAAWRAPGAFTGEALTISAGAITQTQGIVGVRSDVVFTGTLDTINNDFMSDGTVMMLFGDLTTQYAGVRVVSTGNIKLTSDRTMLLDSTTKSGLILRLKTGNWYEIARNTNPPAEHDRLGFVPSTGFRHNLALVSNIIKSKGFGGAITPKDTLCGIFYNLGMAQWTTVGAEIFAVLDNAKTIPAAILTLGGADFQGLDYDGKYIWAADNNNDDVVRFPTVGGGAGVGVAVGTAPKGVLYAFGSIWVANTGSGTVSRVNPATDTVIATVVVGTTPSWLTTDGDYVYVTNFGSVNVSKIDPTPNTSVPIAVGAAPDGICFDGENIWVVCRSAPAQSVYKIVAETGVATEVIGGLTTPEGCAFDGVRLWVANHGANELRVYDIETDALIRTIATGAGTGPTRLSFDRTHMRTINEDDITDGRYLAGY